MNRTGNQFLPRSTLTADEDRRGSGSDLPDQGINFHHGRRIAYQIAQNALVAELAAQPLRFLHEVVLLNGPLKKSTQDSGLNGLLQEPKGFQIVNDGNRLVDAAESSQNDGGGAVSPRG